MSHVIPQCAHDCATAAVAMRLRERGRAVTARHCSLESRPLELLTGISERFTSDIRVGGIDTDDEGMCLCMLAAILALRTLRYEYRG